MLGSRAEREFHFVKFDPSPYWLFKSHNDFPLDLCGQRDNCVVCVLPDWLLRGTVEWLHTETLFFVSFCRCWSWIIMAQIKWDVRTNSRHNVNLSFYAWWIRYRMCQNTLAEAGPDFEQHQMERKAYNLWWIKYAETQVRFVDGPAVAGSRQLCWYCSKFTTFCHSHTYKYLSVGLLGGRSSV